MSLTLHPSHHNCQLLIFAGNLYHNLSTHLDKLLLPEAFIRDPSVYHRIIARSLRHLLHFVLVAFITRSEFLWDLAY